MKKDSRDDERPKRPRNRAAQSAAALRAEALKKVRVRTVFYEGGGRDERRRTRVGQPVITVKRGKFSCADQPQQQMQQSGGIGEPEHPGFRRPGEVSFGEETVPSNQPDWPKFGNK